MAAVEAAWLNFKGRVGCERRDREEQIVMAKIWIAEKDDDTLGYPEGSQSLDWCMENLGLQPSHWLAPLHQPPSIRSATFFESLRDRSRIMVVVSQDDLVAASKEWKAGYYHLQDLTRSDVKAKLPR